MSKQQEAMRLALEALEERYVGALRDKAMDALKAALAEEALQRLTDANQEIEAALEQPTRAQAMKDAGYTRRPTLREMAEPEQEPVAWMTPGQDLHLNNGEGFRFSDWTPLFTHPPRREWRRLKEWEINDGLDQLPTEDVCSWSFRKGVYFAEAALKEKNHE